MDKLSLLADLIMIILLVAGHRVAIDIGIAGKTCEE